MLGYPAWFVGLLMAVVPSVLVVAAPVAGILADRIRPRPVTVAGMALLVVGYFAVGTLDERTTPLGVATRASPAGRLDARRGRPAPRDPALPAARGAVVKGS